MVVSRALKENIYDTEFKFNRGLNVFQCHCLVEFRVTSLNDTSRIKLRASRLNIAMEGYVYCIQSCSYSIVLRVYSTHYRILRQIKPQGDQKHSGGELQKLGWNMPYMTWNVESSKRSKHATSFSGPSLFHEKTQEMKREKSRELMPHRRLGRVSDYPV